MSEPTRGDGDDERGLDAVPDLLPLSERLRRDTRAVQAIVDGVASFRRSILERLPEPTGAATPRELRDHARAVAGYRDAYRKFLLATFAFESSVLASLAESPAAGAAHARPDDPLETPPSTTLLRADLVALFGEPVARRAVRMPSLPVIRTLPEWVGTEFVRRRARPGPEVADAVRHNLRVGPANGASHVDRCARQAIDEDGRLRVWIDGHGFLGDDAGAAVGAAIRTFEGLGVWYRMFDAMTR